MRHLVKFLINSCKRSRIITDRHGIKYYDNRMSALEQHIVKKNEFDEYTILCNLLQHFDVNKNLAIDVGANVGLMSLPLATCFKKVIAFEIDPKNAEKFRKNIKLNKNLDIELVEIGVGDCKGVAELSINRSIDGDGLINTGLSSLAKNNRQHSKKLLNVNVTTLDLIAKDSGWNKVDLIKVDTEGFELNVFKGCSRILKEDRPIIFYEASLAIDVRIGEDHRLKCYEYLQRFGYLHYAMLDSQFTEISFDELKDLHADINLIAVPLNINLS